MARLYHVFTLMLMVWGASQCTAAAECPTFWTRWGNHCYSYFGDELSWTDAVNTCRQFSAPGSPFIADLVSVHSEAEHNFLYSYWRRVRQADDRSGHPGMWVGLTDADENGVYKWSDGTSFDYSNFDGRQETSHEFRWAIWDFTDETWNPQGKWHDFVDSHTYQFMCKMPIG